MEPRVEYARAADGTTIAFTSSGSGPPLVLLPSVPFSNFLDEWAVPPLRSAYERLAARFRLVQYDGRGTGHSQRDVADLELEAMIGDLEAVIDQAGLDSAGLLGLFNSCPHALAFAARRPERVTRLALYGGAARGWLPMSTSETQALLGLIEQDWALFTETAAHSWMGWSTGESARLAARAFREGVTPAVARATLQAASAVDVSDVLPRVAQPAVVLHKPGLRQLDETAARALAEALPDGRFLGLPGASAALFLDGAAAAVDALVAFFSGRDPEVAAGSPGARPGRELTAREAEVLGLVAAGQTNGQIAGELGISVHTVERHVANAYRKIDARGRADATAWAIRHGLGERGS